MEHLRYSSGITYAIWALVVFDQYSFKPHWWR